MSKTHFPDRTEELAKGYFLALSGIIVGEKRKKKKKTNRPRCKKEEKQKKFVKRSLNTGWLKSWNAIPRIFQFIPFGAHSFFFLLEWLLHR
jgi:hypothetical protein